MMIDRYHFPVLELMLELYYTCSREAYLISNTSFMSRLRCDDHVSVVKRNDNYVIVVLRNDIELTFGIVFKLFSSLMPEKNYNQNE